MQRPMGHWSAFKCNLNQILQNVGKNPLPHDPPGLSVFETFPNSISQPMLFLHFYCRCKMYMAFETRGLYVSVNIKPSYPCNIAIFTQNVNFLVWHLFHQNQKYFQIFYIFHHSNVFVIVKRLAENYVNPQAFDMYKFGCFEN